MPLLDLQLYGDFSAAGSLRREDRRLLACTKLHEEIKHGLAQVPIPMHLHIANLPVSWDGPTLRSIFHKADPSSAEQKIGYMSVAKFRHIHALPLNAGRNSLNLVFIDNEGENRIPITPWIVAHRLYHALAHAVQHQASTSFHRISEQWDLLLTKIVRIYRCDDNLVRQDVRRDYVNERLSPAEDNRTLLTLLAEHIFETKVCRTHRLNNHYEAIAEVFAEWCISSRIRVRPLPRRIAWAGQKLEAIAADASGLNDEIQVLVNKFKEIFSIELKKALLVPQELLVF